MKKFILPICLALWSIMSVQAQNPLNMTRLFRWDDDQLPLANPGGLNLQYSGCWGIAVNGHEYAFLGGALHVLIFDVTDPVHTKLVGKFAGTNNTVWREFKSYKNRVYEVTDGTSEGMMIFDMSQAPDTIIRSYWSNELFNSSHTITLDTMSGKIYLNGTNVVNNGSLVLDVSQNPDKPTFVAAVPLEGGYIHDSYVRNDTLYASSGYSGFWVYDFKNPTAPVTLASCATGGYNHLGWLTSDGQYAYYTEEIPQGRPIQIVDLQHLSDGEISPVGSFLDNLTPNAGNLAVPHNIYIKNNLLFDSQYEDGLLVYDITIPTNPFLVANYDTHPENTVYNGYYGNWGNYPWLPSGNIIAGDMQDGLYVLKLDYPSVGVKQPAEKLELSVTPNPAHEFFTLRTPFEQSGWNYRISDPNGRLVLTGSVENNAEIRISTEKIPAGVYFAEACDGNGRFAAGKIVVE